MTESLQRYGIGIRTWVLTLAISALTCASASAQFLDAFDSPPLNGWTFFSGDGSATIDFRQNDSFASIFVDARRDKRNIWWAVIKHEVSGSLDLGRLSDPKYELRVSARVRVSHAPRRLNMSFNTQKTVDYHTHLMEFDIPVAHQWQTIRMTTRGFEAVPGDQVNAQLALMDWGLGEYRVDVDDFRVDVVDVTQAEPDQGEPLPYRPPVPPVNSFAHIVVVAQDAVVDAEYPDMSFGGWYVADEEGKTPALAVGGTQCVILRWDLQALAGKKVAQAGLLELTTHSMQRNDEHVKDFGMLRVVEILAGDPAWDQKTVTLDRLAQDQPLAEVFNTQMIIDVDVNEQQGGKTLITISKPVLQRMIDGRTRGLVLRPLGSLHATFYDSEYADGQSAPRLHFNLQE